MTSGLASGLIGGLAAMTASTLTHPVDSLKVRLFLHGEGTAAKGGTGVGVARDILRTEGLRQGFYRGVTATWLRQAVFSTSRFGMNDYLQVLAGKGKAKDLTVAVKVATSCAAGVTASALSCPADVVLVRMQADGKLPVDQRRGYRNAIQGLRSMVREEGVLSLYRGLRPLVLRGGLVTAGQFTTYDTSKKALLARGYRDNTRTHLMASTTAGTVSTMIVNPLDVVKSRVMQAKSAPKDGVSSLVHYTSDWECVKRTYKIEGIRGFYKGLIPCFMRQCPQVILMWMIFEQYKKTYVQVTTSLAQPQAVAPA
ncbi:putative mitochondrial 2-oxoglutarate/malate carrier protein [Diplonema papillatum]|nr:putative mitochondrial 2-oxoglutarate/malate carrier protein [Diplonema papillatum]KAJ9466824.1 putative mitochondrial 2-oxoglutarate/malate carrier protein [Diplonema papillatum]